MSEGAAGYDLFASEALTLPPAKATPTGEVEVGRGLVSTGIALELPPGTVGRIAARSGLSVKFNIETGAGWIDSDYRGEVKVELKNLSAKPFAINVGDRVAQLVVLQLAPGGIELANDVGDTSRGAGGFGSTGR